MAFQATVLADSISDMTGSRLTTMEVTFPRFILAEMNTHRVFSRNSASSRAIPTRRIFTEVRDNPFIPQEFGTYQPGMVSGEALSGVEAQQARDMWVQASRNAIRSAFPLVYGHHKDVDVEDFLAGGDIPASDDTSVHKEFVNRLIEPFMWHTAIISSTEWENFFTLRCADDAQPEIRTIARLMRTALEESTPQELDNEQWHLPLVSDKEASTMELADILNVSAGRCARVSYLSHHKDRDPADDAALAEKLLVAKHMSPFEHQAKPVTSGEKGNFSGWAQYRQFVEQYGD